MDTALAKHNTTGLSNEATIGSADMLFNEGAMACIERASVLMAKARATIPDHLKNSPADCMAVIMQSAQWKMNPFSVSQKTHLVNGVLGYEAQLVNAVITSNAPVEGRLRFEWFGDWNKVLGKFASKKNEKGKIYHVPNWEPKDEQGLGVKVWATIKCEDEPRELELLLVQAQVRNSTLWASDPKQQLAYLAIKRWARLHTPDVIMGVYTPDELEERKPMRDMGDAEVVGSSVDDLLGGDQPEKKAPAGPSQSDIDGCVKAFASINVTEPMICAYASLQRVNDMSLEDLNKLRKAYVEITKNNKPLSDYFKVNQPADDIEDAVMAVSEEQLVALINDADSVESLDDVQALLEGLDSDESKERVAGMIGVRRSEFDG